MIRIGYACISIPLRKKGVYTGRTVMLATIKKKGSSALTLLQELSMQNITDLAAIIAYNETIGIRFFRITSNLFPHMGNPRTGVTGYNIDFASVGLAAAGKLAREFGHRITTHPGQYTQLASPTPRVVEQSIVDLNMHANILIAMGMTPESGSVIIIHGGGRFGDAQAALLRFEQAFNTLPKATRDYISLENDEYNYSVLDLLPICERLHIPLCIDFFHHSVQHYKQFDIYDPALVNRVMNTWKLRGIKPKCHWSNQKPGTRAGTHGDCVRDIPAQILQIASQYSVDIMIEAKQKDKCALKVLKRHFTRRVNNGRVEWVLK
jgi:UV DNA damage endonuclease